MFCSALAEAAGATGRADWADAGSTHRRLPASFTCSVPRDGRWMRSWQAGEARHLAYAGDYAWVVDCMTRVGELTGEARWLDTAAKRRRGP